MTNIKDIIILLSGVLLLIVTVLLGIDGEKIAKKDNALTTQNAAISAWQQSAKQLQERLTQQEIEANKAMKIANTNANKTMQEKVSPVCEQAAKWAFQKAQEMKK